jgi:hypothetical protein
MVQDLAERMTRAAWDVYGIMGFPDHPEGRVIPGYQRTGRYQRLFESRPSHSEEAVA